MVFIFPYKVEKGVVAIMCEASVYLIDEDGNEKPFFDSVDIIEPFGGGLCFVNIFSQRKYIKAKIREMSLTEGRIVIEKDTE